MIEITFGNGIIIKNPEDRIREYCKIEIYRGYDDRHEVNQTISWENINVANKVFARIGTEVAEKIIESEEIRNALTIIANKELGEIIDDEWINYREKLRNLLISSCSIKDVGLAVATKILHIKRPKLIPILDSFVIKLLLGIDTTNIADKSYRADIGIRTIDVIRTDIKNNWDNFIRLRELLSDLPIPLEIVRMYDILVWTTQKWDIRGDLTGPYGKPCTRS
jgi:hypothetical protein